MCKCMYIWVSEGSNDEGIHIARPRGAAHANIARSLPISVPNFTMDRTPVKEIDDYVRIDLITNHLTAN